MKEAGQGRTFWASNVPDFDDFGNPIHDVFIDGATRFGYWALMTPESHVAFGVGLGTGYGQKYQKQPIVPRAYMWLKVEG